MADNSVEINEINELLNSGATQVTLPDGQSVAVNPAELRKRRAELAATDDAAKSKRPRILGINISGVT